MDIRAAYTVQIAPMDPKHKNALRQLVSKRETYAGDAGFDLPMLESVIVPGEAAGFKVHLGIQVRVRKYLEPCIDRPGAVTYTDWPWWLVMRSSTATKTRLRLANSIGIVDSGYRGEIMAIVDNPSVFDFVIEEGRSLFQMIIPDGTPMELPHCRIILVPQLDETARNDAGFGSTGQ